MRGTLLIFILTLLASSAAPALPGNAAIREQFFELADGGARASAALANLRARPRAEVIYTLRQDLLGDPTNPLPLMVKAVLPIDGVELVPDLVVIVRLTHEALPINVLTRLASAHAEIAAPMAALYQDLVRREVANPALIAMLDSLGTFRASVDADTFASALGSHETEVSLAAVRHFLLTRAILEPEERTRRFVEVLTTKTNAARLLAIRAFAHLSWPERRALRANLPAEFCRQETDSTIKLSCSEALSSLP